MNAITRPMSIVTIQVKLLKQEYHNYLQLFYDIILTITNSMFFNF